jgi:predicted ATP-grasp superfamily ATP-dependent carboligase
VTRNPFTLAKAWKIEAPDEFLPAYERAATYVGPDQVVVQEMVPGGGECQFSYGSLWNEGRPVAELTARRNRQFPIEFGFTSTCVEIVDQPDVLEAGRRFTQSLGYHGLIEVEFKRDPRTGELKLLDVNPRPWSWFALAEAAGVPLGPMLWAMIRGEPLPKATGPRIGVTWMYLPRDVVSAGYMMARGMLSPVAYLKSFARVRAWAAFHASDPLPALLDIPLAVSRLFTKRLMARIRSGSGRPAPAQS